MFIRSYIIFLLALSLFASCENASTSSVKKQFCNENSPTITSKESIDSNFNLFIDKFSADSSFQLSRTKFPLKIKWYDIENDNDSLFYKNKSNFEIVDFRQKKSKGVEDQWEQKIVLNTNNTLATIEIHGIDNGILVNYFFEKVNGAWILIAIEDIST
jgi:hypothetical protein